MHDVANPLFSFSSFSYFFFFLSFCHSFSFFLSFIFYYFLYFCLSFSFSSLRHRPFNPRDVGCVRITMVMPTKGIVEVKTKHQNLILIFENDQSKLRILVYSRLENPPYHQHSYHDPHPHAYLTRHFSLFAILLLTLFSSSHKQITLVIQR